MRTHANQFCGYKVITQGCRREIVQLGREKKELPALLLLCTKTAHFWVQQQGVGEKLKGDLMLSSKEKKWDKDFKGFSWSWWQTFLFGTESFGVLMKILNFLPEQALTEWGGIASRNLSWIFGRNSGVEALNRERSKRLSMRTAATAGSSAQSCSSSGGPAHGMCSSENHINYLIQDKRTSWHRERFAQRESWWIKKGILCQGRNKIVGG